MQRKELPFKIEDWINPKKQELIPADNSFKIPNTGYTTLDHTTMLLNRIPLFTHVNKTTEQHEATKKNKIVRMNKYGSSELITGCLTPLHRNIIDLLLSQPVKYGTHTTIVRGQEYRSCIFTPATLLEDLGDIHKSKEWLLEKLQEMKMATFILKPTDKHVGYATKSMWDSLTVSVFNEVRSYGERRKHYQIEVHFQITFLELWKYDMTLNFSPLISKIISIEQPWLQNIVRFVLTQQRFNQYLHSLFFDTGLYCDYSIKLLKNRGMLLKDFEPNEVDKISNQQYREYRRFILLPETRHKLDYLFGEWPDGQEGSYSKGRGIHLIPAKDNKDYVVYFERDEDAVDDNNKDLIYYNKYKKKLAPIEKKVLSKFDIFEQILYKELEANPKSSPLELLINNDSVYKALKALSFKEQKEIYESFLEMFKNDLNSTYRLTKKEDDLIGEANHQILNIELYIQRKLKEAKDKDEKTKQQYVVENLNAEFD